MDKVVKILEAAVDRIKDNMSSQNINASGKTAEGFRVRVLDDRIQLIYTNENGGAPLTTTEIGRDAGAIPMDFVSIIEQWANDRGLTFTDDKELRSFAGAVAFGKIKRKGYGRPSPSDFGSESRTIYSDVVFETAVELHNKLPQIFVSYIKTKIYGRGR